MQPLCAMRLRSAWQAVKAGRGPDAAVLGALVALGGLKPWPSVGPYPATKSCLWRRLHVLI